MKEKKKLFFDMDGVLVDFQSGIEKLSDDVKREYEGRLDEVPGIFALMEPMQGAIDAVHKLSEFYDVYILSTAPWKNPSAWSDKISWVTKYFGNLFHKRVIITHCKHLCQGDYLIDDRGKNGTSEFSGEWIEFGSNSFPDWDSVLGYLLSPDKYTVYLQYSGHLKRSLVSESMVDNTVKILDDYMKVIDERHKDNCTKEYYNEVRSLAKLTNRWLKAMGEDSETAYYDI